MQKTRKNYLLLFLILIFSFIYRVAVMMRETFPPGADIGLHNSVIHSITQGGTTNFLWNSYHMGGGSSVTFPGYHIFTSYIILLTGLSDFVAHALVVSMFSTLIVAAAFLLTRRVWNASAALIVAFLLAVSRFDIEMLMWGGYPNVVALMLMPLAFYLFLQKDKLSAAQFLVTSGLVCGAIFLTHSLSSALFVAITVSTVAFTFVFAGKMGERRASLLSWLASLLAGAIAISPFLIDVIPAYLGADANTFTGGIAAIRDALLSTKLLPLEIVVPLLFFVFLYFPFSKYYAGRFLTVPTILLVFWWLIPTVLTQGYLLGLYTDYSRFLYFVILPITVLIGLGLYHSARFLGQASEWLSSMAKELPEVKMSKSKTLKRVMPLLKQRNLAFVLVLIFIMYSFLCVPLFAAPSTGIGVQSFYQLMNEPRYEAIQWAKNNTTADAVFLTDAQYGWWFSGFAQRRTISAVEPEYLTNSREFEPAKLASYVLDTDFLIDNGLLQVREDGGYIGRHNPDILAKRHDYYFPTGMFTFDNNDITIQTRDSTGNYQETHLVQVPVTDQHLENDSDQASIYVTRGNENFTFASKTTVYQRLAFANVTTTVTITNPSLTIVSVTFLVHKGGMKVEGENPYSFAFFDTNQKVAGQLIFPTDQKLPRLTEITRENPVAEQVSYIANDSSQLEMNFYAGAYEYTSNPDKNKSQTEQDAFYSDIVKNRTSELINYTRANLNETSGPPLEVFDYHQALSYLNISYVALRDSGQISRFAKDPAFSLVFINDEVAIFRVNT